MPDVFGISTSALQSLQQAINTTGQNIANVNTEGYSRQTVQFATREPERSGGFFLGSGVQIQTVERAFDRFLTADVQSRTASASYFENLAATGSRVDELFGDTATGVGVALEDFFASMEAVANSPTTLPERQVMLSEADTLAQRFDYIDTRLNEFQTELNVKIDAAVGDVNQFAASIAELNTQISLQSAQSGGNPSADLLDLRDQLITELAELVGVTTQSQEDGALNVFIGKGQPLVVGANAAQLSSAPNPLLPNKLDIFLVTQGASGANITSQLTDGSLGAAIDSGNDIIDEARRQIGLLAAGLTLTFNEIFTQGFDLNGDLGTDFFDPSSAVPQVTNDGTGVVSASILDITQLTGENYRVDVDAGNFVVTNLSTGVSETVVPVVDGNDLVIDDTVLTTATGLEFRFVDGNTTAAPSNGDTYVIEPTATSSANFGVLITDPSKIAAALEDPDNPGFTSGVGDNRNMLALLDLRDQSTLIGGANYFDLYTNTTSDVAVQTRRASSLAETESSLLSSAQSRKGNLAGVNLEEEAANLIRYQQAYQAAAQVVRTAQDVFDILIRATE